MNLQSTPVVCGIFSPGMAGGATLTGVCARLAIVAFALGIAGCASAPTATTAYVGEFTGEFVDGMPLYRLPAIEVVGTRRSVDKDM
jgi:hypothetical protein